MRFVLLKSLLLSVGLWNSAFALSPKNKETPSNIKIAKISNGMELIAVPSQKVPLVTIVLAVKAGAMTETKDINGLTHLWEHMFFKGNARYPDQEAFKKRIKELGIVYNGDTSAEKVRYYFTLPSAFLSEGLQFMADAISTPLLDNKELERERKVVLDEYDRNASRPDFEIYKIQQGLIYGEKSFHRDALGIRKIIENATKDQLVRIKNEVFVPANSALLVAGDFDSNKLNSLVEKHFAHWKTPETWKAMPQNEFQKFPETTEVVMTKALVANPKLLIEFEGPRARSLPEDTYPADILSGLLSLGTGKFFKKFIDTGKVLEANIGYFTQSQAGEVSISAALKAENFSAVKNELLAEINQWAKPGYFTNDQLADVQRSLTVAKKREQNQPSEYIKTLAFWWAITGLDYYESYIANLRKLSLKNVQDFVKKYLVGKPFVTSILLSPEDAQKANLKDNSQPLKERFLKDL